MRLRLPSLLLSGALFLGCGTDRSADKPRVQAAPDEHTADGTDHDADHSEAEEAEEDFEDGFDWGEPEVCTVQACREQGEGRAALLREPLTKRTMFVSSSCTAVATFDGEYVSVEAPAGYDGATGCRCVGRPDRDEDYFLYYRSEEPSCLAHGRNGACLYSSERFPGCDITGEGSCDSLCADLRNLLNSDERHGYADAHVRAARCLTDSDCAYIIEAEGGCTVNNWFAYDCSASDEEMFSAYAASAPH